MNRDYTFRLLYDEDNGVYRTQCDELAGVIDFACGEYQGVIFYITMYNEKE